jgi:hypothetical protein
MSTSESILTIKAQPHFYTGVFTAKKKAVMIAAGFSGVGAVALGTLALLQFLPGIPPYGGYTLLLGGGGLVIGDILALIYLQRKHDQVAAPLKNYFDRYINNPEWDAEFNKYENEKNRKGWDFYCHRFFAYHGINFILEIHHDKRRVCIFPSKTACDEYLLDLEKRGLITTWESDQPTGYASEADFDENASSNRPMPTTKSSVIQTAD